MLLLTYILLMIKGILHGCREYFHKDSRIFERLFKVQEKGFFGSLQWVRKYKDYPQNQRPKNWLLSIFPYNDFWHASHYAGQSLSIIGVIYLCRMENAWFDFTGSFWGPFLFAQVVMVFWGGFTFWVITVQNKNKNKT